MVYWVLKVVYIYEVLIAWHASEWSRLSDEVLPFFLPEPSVDKRQTTDNRLL